MCAIEDKRKSNMDGRGKLRCMMDDNQTTTQTFTSLPPLSYLALFAIHSHPFLSSTPPTMPIRRVTPNTTPQQHHQQQQQHQQHQHLPAPATLKPSPSLPSFTRSASPSSISNIFTRPAKWFQRSNSASRPPLPEPRPSTSSISSNRRKPTISGPTDPRPILNSQDHSQQSQVAATPPFAALNDRATRCVVVSFLSERPLDAKKKRDVPLSLHISTHVSLSFHPQIRS